MDEANEKTKCLKSKASQNKQIYTKKNWSKKQWLGTNWRCWKLAWIGKLMLHMISKRLANTLKVQPYMWNTSNLSWPRNCVKKQYFTDWFSTKWFSYSQRNIWKRYNSVRQVTLGAALQTISDSCSEKNKHLSKIIGKVKSWCSYSPLVWMFCIISVPMFCTGLPNKQNREKCSQSYLWGPK